MNERSPSGLSLPRSLLSPRPERQEPCCATCTFSWHDLDGDLNCRRLPPVPFLEPMSDGRYRTVTAIPSVAESHWCGEWREKTTD